MTYRILTLDGGGCWSLLQAMALERVFGGNTKGRDILSQFDIVSANSGGSIVLGALIANLTPLQIRDLFQKKSERESIFVWRPFWKRRSSARRAQK